MTFLGIDGGGSKTAFLLESDSGQILAQFETGPSNWVSSGPERSRESLVAGIQALPQPPHIVGAGFAGAGRPEARAFYLDCLKSLLPDAKIFIETDAVTTYFGAIGPNPGVLLIAGTGSIAIALKDDGTIVRAGGWGATFGDEGSGFWIGRTAISKALQSHDAGVSPDFVFSISEALGLKAITEVPTSWIRGSLDVPKVAEIARVLLEGPTNGPGFAIVLEAAAHLRALAELARERAGLAPSCVRVSSGSVASHPFIRSAIGLPFSPALHSPARGAILLARDRMRP